MDESVDVVDDERGTAVGESASELSRKVVRAGYRADVAPVEAVTAEFSAAPPVVGAAPGVEEKTVKPVVQS